MQTARGNEFFSLYEGNIILDEQTFKIPVHLGANFSEILLRCQWLEIMGLVVNKPQNLLTLTLLEQSNEIISIID